MASGPADGLPVATEDPESIAARMLGDLNAGLEPTDPRYVHDRRSGWAGGIIGAVALEDDRVRDTARQIATAALPSTAVGTQLEAWAAVFDLQRKPAVKATGIVEFDGAPGVEIPAGTPLSTESPTPDSPPIEFETIADAVVGGDGDVEVEVQALVAGSRGNVEANSITIIDADIAVTVSNPARITSGDDTESDARLQGRVLGAMRSTGGGGNVDYYVNRALNIPGVGYVTVQPNVPSLGHVRLMIADVNNDPVSSVLLARVQADVDPSGTAAQGEGSATIGATVVVATPDALSVAIAAAVTPEAGYSITGVGGTRRLYETIRDAITEYVDSLQVGEDVMVSKVLAAIVSVEGVADATNVNLGSGIGVNRTVSATQVAVMGTVTLP